MELENNKTTEKKEHLSTLVSSSNNKEMELGGIRQPIRQFLCIEYPGCIKNVDKAIETLGGIEQISEVYSEANRRMEVRFRPGDVFCKPACGERHSSTSLLIKVVKRKKKKKLKLDEVAKPTASTEESNVTYSTHLEGVVHTIYKFNTLCDFQYLPVINREVNEHMEYTSIQEHLVPRGIANSSWLSISAPLFLPPAAFSRMDTPQDYRYRREHALEGKKKIPQNIICRTRLPRTHHAIFCTYKQTEVPQKPLQGATLQVQYKFLDGSYFEKLKEEFEKRPIWSKNALAVRLGFTSDNLKYLLPTLSYYFHTGPWRNLWVKLGHDPRKDPNSWFYQTFDFRIRQAGGVKSKVEAKRSYSNYVLPYKSANCSKKKTSVIQSQHFEDIPTEENATENEAAAKPEDKDSIYIFRPGMIPPYRQMFYQYCDIHVPEIQKLLEESVLSGATQTCTEKNGWLPSGVEATCRDIVSRLVEATIAEQSAEGKEVNVPSEESSSDEKSSEEEEQQ